MLAYRHAFHAGSHADVLKHLVLAQVLRHMAGKDKAYTLLDTHAGAGGYSLEGRYALTKGEFESGIARLWSLPGLPGPLAAYVALVRQFNGGGNLEQYPGSPGIAQMLLRPTDRLRLYELHPTDHKILEAFVGGRPQTHVAMSDGFAALQRDLPPPSRRGVLLIDPSYEMKTDYARVVGAVREALQRFAQGVVIVWYPQVQLIEATQLPKRLMAAAAAAPKGWLHATLNVRAADPAGFGMTGSAVFVINPPFTLHEDLTACLPVLVEHLGQYDGARYVLEHTGGG
jgi:23S rRNA (adenine2030-N6)-methyltransferase